MNVNQGPGEGETWQESYGLKYGSLATRMKAWRAVAILEEEIQKSKKRYPYPKDRLGSSAGLMWVEIQRRENTWP